MKDLSNKNLIESLIKSLPGLFVLFDLDGKIHWWNYRLEYYSGYTSERIENTKVLDFFGGKNRKGVEEKIGEVLRTGRADLEIRIRSEGKTIPFLLTGTSVNLSGAEYIIATGVDITSKEKEYLEKVIQEKNLLLEEAHHRIKNNLSTASGLLKLQAAEYDNEDIKEQFTESESRLHSMALIHQLLYEQKNYTRLNFRLYIDKMIDHVVILHNAHKDCIETVIDEDLYLDISKSVPCALIIHELVSNAIKHSYQRRNDFSVKVLLSNKDGQNTLVVWDNGNETFDIDQTTGLGMKLIRGLTAQINGTMDVSFEDGVSFTIRFES